MIPKHRRELFSDINVLLKSGGGNLYRSFPYTDEEMMLCRVTFWEKFKGAFRRK